MLMLRHIDPLAAKADTFHLQTRTLFQASFVFQLDFATRAHYPLPRQRPAGLRSNCATCR